MYSDYFNPDRVQITVEHRPEVESGTQLRQVPKPVQRAGVGQSVHIGNGASVNDVADRELGDLAADGPGDVRYRNDLSGHMVRAGVLPNPAFDPGHEVLGQAGPLPQPHKQHDSDVALPFLANYKAFNNFRQLFHLAVDLRGADPDPARIEGRVAPAKNHQTIMPGQPGPVAVTPDAGILAEVRGVILGPVGVVPEPDRHAGKGVSANQFTFGFPYRAAFGIEPLDANAQPPGLKLPPPHRPDRVSQGEAGDD